MAVFDGRLLWDPFCLTESDHYLGLYYSSVDCTKSPENVTFSTRQFLIESFKRPLCKFFETIGD